MEKVIIPELGEGIKKATIACWHKRVGEQIGADDDLLEVVTDKASFNIVAGSTGKIKEILIQEGNDATIGEVVAIIEQSKT